MGHGARGHAPRHHVLSIAATSRPWPGPAAPLTASAWPAGPGQLRYLQLWGRSCIRCCPCPARVRLGPPACSRLPRARQRKPWRGRQSGGPGSSQGGRPTPGETQDSLHWGLGHRDSWFSSRGCSRLSAAWVEPSLRCHGGPGPAAGRGWERGAAWQGWLRPPPARPVPPHSPGLMARPAAPSPRHLLLRFYRRGRPRLMSH